MIFTTAADGVATLWACADWAPDNHRVRYVRVTPGDRFGFVDVQCEVQSACETRVDVGYQFTALSPSGIRYLEGLTPSAFAAMIEDWKRLILEKVTN